ncbi:hypothetical protein [Nocardia sp. alder85J]|nr:hypothetical protein [Nocardia sp. alder85J]MCX4095336.1 hypothetical protein [Nocardia sp. alder85J]
MSTTGSNNKPNTTPEVPTKSMREDVIPELTRDPFKVSYAKDLPKPAAL